MMCVGLAVESLLSALDNKKPISEESRSRVIETLHGNLPQTDLPLCHEQSTHPLDCRPPSQSTSQLTSLSNNILTSPTNTDTLATQGMAHTTSSLDMLTSRSVDVSKITVGTAICPNKVPVDFEQVTRSR